MRADTDYQPPPRRQAAPQPPAALQDQRGGVGDRIAEGLGELRTRAGHAALDLSIAGVKAAARNPKEFIPAAGAGALLAADTAAAADPAASWPLIFGAMILAGYLLHRRNKHTAPGMLARAYQTLGYLTALTYSATAAVLAPSDTLALQILGIGALATSSTWWARHYRRRQRATAPTEQPSDEERELLRLRTEARAWWTESGADERRGFAPGSSLIGQVHVDDIAIRLDVQLDANRQTFDELTSPQVRKRMAATRGVSRALILVTRWDDQREDRAHVIIFRRYLVAENIPYPGPNIDVTTGCATVGRCADGSPALVRYWMPGSGTWHEIVAGGSGSGKSRYLDQALIGERHALDSQGRHLIVSWICDPQGGQSLPDWQPQEIEREDGTVETVHRVDEFARDLPESFKLVQRAHAEMLARNKLLARIKWTDKHGNQRMGLKEYDPALLEKLGIYLPILSLTLEEAPMLLQDPRIRRWVEDMVKMARKCGIRIRLVTQVPSIAELGNSFTIRPLLAFMSVICLRTTEAISNGAFPNLPGDPRQLEEFFPDGSPTFGLGYILGAVKPALFRTSFLDDVVVYDWANSGTTAHLEPLAAAEGAASAGAESSEVADATDSEAATADSGPETPAVGNARQMIRRYLEMHPGFTTSAILVADLGLNPSTVSQAGTRGAAAGEFMRFKHGVYAALGTDPGMWGEYDETGRVAA